MACFFQLLLRPPPLPPQPTLSSGKSVDLLQESCPDGLLVYNAASLHILLTVIFVRSKSKERFVGCRDKGSFVTDSAESFMHLYGPSPRTRDQTSACRFTSRVSETTKIRFAISLTQQPRSHRLLFSVREVLTMQGPLP